MMLPMTQMTAPVLGCVSTPRHVCDLCDDTHMIADFLPKRSERKPEQRAASQEPPAIEAVMPPCTSDLGPRQAPGGP